MSDRSLRSRGFAVLAVVVLLTPVVAGEWPLFRGSDARTGAAPGDVHGDILEPGTRWTRNASSAVVASPVAADLDGDGRPEVVHAEWGGLVVATRADGSTLWTTRVSAVDGVMSTPLVADVDLDGHLDVTLATGADGRVVALAAATGATKWAYTVGEVVISSPAAADLDGNAGNGLEIVVPAGDARVHVIHGKGTTLNPPAAYWRADLDGPSGGSAALADLTGDGEPELVFTTGFPEEVGLIYPTARAGGGSVYAFERDGTLLWNWSFPLSGDYRESIATPAIGDLTGDGEPEVVVGSANAHVYVWTADARGVGAMPAAASPDVGRNVGIASPAVADLTGDGAAEVVIPTWDGVQRYRFTGSALVAETTAYAPPLPPGAPSGTTNALLASPLVVDVNGDGVRDVVAATAPIYLNTQDPLNSRGQPGTMFAVDGATWTPLWRYGPLGDMVAASPGVADLDGTGSVQLLVAEGFPLVGTGGGRGVHAVHALNPIARFSVTPDAPRTVDDVRFTDASWSDAGTLAAWAWDFGDGNASAARSPTHTYAAQGTYTVRLVVTDDAGRHGYRNATVIVGNTPPVATPAWTVEAADPLTVRFTANAHDPDGAVTAHAWTFGDGATSADADPVHAYATGGTYAATLTVTDDEGTETTAPVTVQVNRAPTLTAPAEVTGRAGEPLTVAVTAADADGDAVALALANAPPGAAFQDHGDGTGTLSWTPTEEHVGVHTARVTATDAGAPTRRAHADLTVDVASAVEPGFVPEREKRVPADATVTLGFRAHDERGRRAMMEALALPPNATFDAGRGLVTWNTGSAGGDHTIRLRAAADDFEDTLEVNATVVPARALDLIVGATPADRVNPTGFLVTGADGASVKWTFGNAWARATGDSVAHVFTDLGAHAVTAYVQDGDAEYALTRVVDVVNLPPVADTRTPAHVPSGASVTFEDASRDADGDIMEREWAFSDGVTLTGATVTREFPDDGVMDVALTVTDADGDMDTVTRSFLVDGTPPVTRATVTDAPETNGWFTRPVRVHLDATDPAPGSGVAEVRHALGDAEMSAYEEPVRLRTEGRHSVTYHAVDEAGNTEDARMLTVGVDLRYPTVFFPGLLDVNVLRAHVTDTGSGLARVEFRLDDRLERAFELGGARAAKLEHTPSPAFGDWGVRTFTVIAEDVAGRVSTRETQVVIVPSP